MYGKCKICRKPLKKFYNHKVCFECARKYDVEGEIKKYKVKVIITKTLTYGIKAINKDIIKATLNEHNPFYYGIEEIKTYEKRKDIKIENIEELNNNEN